jgi:hypothetical protein
VIVATSRVLSGTWLTVAPPLEDAAPGSAGPDAAPDVEPDEALALCVTVTSDGDAVAVLVAVVVPQPATATTSTQAKIGERLAGIAGFRRSEVHAIRLGP